MITSLFNDAIFSTTAALIEEWDGSLHVVALHTPDLWDDGSYMSQFTDDCYIHYEDGTRQFISKAYLFKELSPRELIAPAWAAVKEYVDRVEYEQALLEDGFIDDIPF